MPAAETNLRMTSMRLSSPIGSPWKPAYHVHMPSDDECFEERKTSAHSRSGSAISLLGFPNEPESSALGRHSQELSSGRLSDFTMSGPRTIFPSNGTQWSRFHSTGGKRRKELEEAEEEMDEEDTERSPCGHPFCLFILVIIVLLLLVVLILWVVSRSQEPKITMHSIAFEDFHIHAGVDNSSVPTMMATLNCTVNLTYHSPSFGVHVTSMSLDLSYLELTLASGKMDGFYQSKESRRDIDVVVTGNEVPLYGAGSSLSSKKRPVPLTLSFRLRSSAHLFGLLVKSNFHSSIQCSVQMDQTKLNTPISLKRSCRYSTKEKVM